MIAASTVIARSGDHDSGSRPAAGVGLPNAIAPTWWSRPAKMTTTAARKIATPRKRPGRVEARRRRPVAARDPAPRPDADRDGRRRGPAESVEHPPCPARPPLAGTGRFVRTLRPGRATCRTPPRRLERPYRGRARPEHATGRELAGEGEQRQHADRHDLQRPFAQVDAETGREDARAVQVCEGAAELGAPANELHVYRHHFKWWREVKLAEREWASTRNTAGPALDDATAGESKTTPPTA